MSRQLAVGNKIRLSGIDERDFQITDVLGVGGSCVAYKVTFDEADGIRHAGILKEYCPDYLGLRDVNRATDPQIIIPDRHKELFQHGLADFSETYRAISDYLLQHDEAVNYHPVPLGLYHGNGTVYSLSSLDFGKSYDKIEDRELKAVLRVMHSLSLAISQYHEAGYLHLDIKPANVLILDGVTDLVKLFDYDSLLPVEKLRRREVQAIPQPGIYYVPELSDGNLRVIGVSTDIFELGALLFLRLFGRAPEADELEDDVEYPWDSAPLTVGIPPQAKYELEQLLRNTLRISTRKRYQTDSQLLAQIEKVLSLLKEERPYPVNLPKWQPSAYHLGREKEIRELRSRLLKNGYVFLRGMGGIGKSELAKQYAKQFGQEYHTVQFCKYTDSLETLIAAIPMHGLKDTDYTNLTALAEEKRKLLHQCDSHTLLVVDNFNVTYDKLLRDFLPVDGEHFHVILTTRCVPAPEYYAPMVMPVPALSSDDCLELFCRHFGRQLDPQQSEDARRLVERVERNTLLLQLSAKAMRRANLLPAQMLEIFNNQTAETVSPEIFFEYDYSNEETEAYNRLYGHLNTVYSVSSLTSVEKAALKCLTLVSPAGMPLCELNEACASDPEIPVEAAALATLGWIEIDKEQRISMHQVVSDVMAQKPELEVPPAFERIFDDQLSRCEISPEVHFTVAMAHLTTAIHLNRRCKDVDPEYQIDCKLTLGVLYRNLYQAKNAGKLFLEAEAISKGNDELYLPYILLQKGISEAQFGRQQDAAAIFEQAIQSSEADLDTYAATVFDAMTQQAVLLADNNENEAALRAYDRAISFGAENGLTEELSDIFSECMGLCKELDDAQMARYYRQLSAQLTGQEAAAQEDPFFAYFAQGQVQAAQREYASMLEEIREAFGAESPVYHDAARWQWLISVMLGDKESAFSRLNEATAFVEKYYGQDSVEMAEVLSWAGRTMPELGELSFAMDAAHRAIEILESEQSTGKYAYVRSKLAEAQIFLLRGQSEEATKLLDSVSFESYEGEAVLDDLIRVAAPLLCDVSRYDEALALSQKVLSRSDADATSLMFAKVISATCYEQQGDLKRASKIAEQIDKNEIDGFDVPALKNAWKVMYYRCMSRLAYRNGNYEDAIRQLDALTGEDESENALYMHRVYSERGLFHAELGHFKEAESDFLRAESIMKEHQLPEDAYLLLYNNISILYTNLNEPERAKQFLDKAIRIRPQVLAPQTYLETLLCANVGWNAVLLDDIVLGESLLKRSISRMEELGLQSSELFWNNKRNLGLLYIKTGQIKAAIKLYLEIVDGLAHCKGGIQTPLRLKAVTELVQLQYQDNRAAESRRTSKNADAWFANLYGTGSEMYVELLLQLEECALSFGDGRTAKFFSDKLKPICLEGEQKNTVYHARWQNNQGCCFFEVDNDSFAALACFVAAANILENLEETDSELYSLIQQNIKYIR